MAMDQTISGSQHTMDTGWAWVIFVAVFFGRTIQGCMYGTLNIYIKEFLDTFKESRSYTATIGGVGITLFAMSGPLTTLMMRQAGVRMTIMLGSIVLSLNYIVNAFATSVLYLIFFYGILYGVGVSMVNNGLYVALSLYFRKYLYLVTGISSVGNGIGLFILGAFLPKSIEIYGWRGSMFLIAGCALQHCIVGSLVFPTNRKQDNRRGGGGGGVSSSPQQQGHGQEILALLSTSKFWLMAVTNLLGGMGFGITQVLYRDFTRSIGLDHHFSWVLSSFGAGDMLSRVVVGMLLSHKNMNSLIINTASHLILVGIYAIHLAAKTLPVLLSLSFSLGFVMGTFGILQVSLPIHLFGQKSLALTLGYNLPAAGLGFLIGPYFAGLIRDYTGNYDYTMLFASSAELASTLVCLAMLWKWRAPFVEASTEPKPEEMKLETIDKPKNDTCNANDCANV